MRLLALAVSVSAVALAAACAVPGQDEARPGDPVETRPANGTTQQPAFAGQTRAPGVRTDVAMAHTVVASGLVEPWGLALLPDGRWLVTERPGRLRIIRQQHIVVHAIGVHACGSGFAVRVLGGRPACGKAIQRRRTNYKSTARRSGEPSPVASPTRRGCAGCCITKTLAEPVNTFAS